MSTVTLADAKDYLGMTTTNAARDARLQRFLDAADSQFAGLLPGPIAPTTFTEVHDGGAPFIMLRQIPVISITSLTEYVGLTGYPVTLQPLGSTTSMYGYSFVPESGKVVRRDSAGVASWFQGGTDAVTVTYVAGEATVDPAVYLALLEDVRAMFSQSQFGATTVVVGDEQQDNAWNPIGMFPRLQAMLQGKRLPGIA